ncbi:TetR family transcriptional regulator [Yinghuangia aomiensis]
MSGSPRSDDIRAAALDLFTRRGYEATTMADIGAAVGIRGPSLYKHVASKQDLLAGVITGAMNDLLALHRRRRHHRGSGRGCAGPPRRTALPRPAPQGGVRRDPRAAQPSGAAPLRRAALRAAYESGFRELVNAGVEAGRFRVASARLTSYAILTSAWASRCGSARTARSARMPWCGSTANLRCASPAPPAGLSPAASRFDEATHLTVNGSRGLDSLG